MAEVKKYNQLDRPVQDEIDRIDESLGAASEAIDGQGISIPFGRVMPGGGGIDYDKIYVGGVEYTPGENTEGYDFLQVGADGSSSWIKP